MPTSRTHRLAKTADDPAEDIGVLLTRALSDFKRRLHAHLAGAGYSDLGPSFGFVFRLLAEQPLSLAELAGRLGITPQGALKIVSEMVDSGYVERVDDDADRRVRRLVLTTRGQGALRQARRFHASVEKELVARLGSRTVAAARDVLGALAAATERDASTEDDSRSAGVIVRGEARPF